MFRKSDEVGTLVAHTLASHKYDLLSPNELENIIMDTFFLQRMNIEVHGRNRRFDECQKMIKKQSELLADMDSATLTKYPVLTAMHLEQTILVDRANYVRTNSTDDSFWTSTPELVKTLGGLSLNPSGINYK